MNIKVTALTVSEKSINTIWKTCFLLVLLQLLVSVSRTELHIDLSSISVSMIYVFALICKGKTCYSQETTCWLRRQCINCYSHSYELYQSIFVLRDVGCILHFYSNFNRAFCKKTVDTLIRSCALVWFCTHKKDARLIWVYRVLLTNLERCFSLPELEATDPNATPFSELVLCFDFLPNVLWLLVFCGSASQCRRLICNV